MAVPAFLDPDVDKTPERGSTVGAFTRSAIHVSLGRRDQPLARDVCGLLLLERVVGVALAQDHPEDQPVAVPGGGTGGPQQRSADVLLVPVLRPTTPGSSSSLLVLTISPAMPVASPTLLASATSAC
jgi:hypothetical protein